MSKQGTKRGEKTAYPGVRSLGRGLYRVRGTFLSPKTGRKREVERVVEAKSAADAAGQKFALVEAAKREPEATRERTRVKTFASWWLRSRLNELSPSTPDRYATVLQLHVVNAPLGDYYLDRVTHSDILEWRDAQAAQPTTVNDRLRVLRTLFASATAEHDLPRNPCANVRALRVGPRKKELALSADELGRLLAAVRADTPQWFPIIATLAYTGARIGEVAALEWRDIDWANATLHIRRAQWRNRVGKTKTGRTRRLPLLPPLAATLKAHRVDLLKRQAPGLDRGLVFPNRRGTYVISSSLRKPLDQAAIAAGLGSPNADGTWTGKRPTVHGFRHTTNDLLRRAASSEVQRSITGHSTEAMSEHYASIDQAERQEAMRAAFAEVSEWGPGWGSPPETKTTG